MIDVKILLEQRDDVLLSQMHVLKLVRKTGDVVGATPLQMQQRRDSLVRTHQGRIARMGIGSALCRWRMELVVIIFRGEALRFGKGDIATKAVDFLFHLRMLGSLSDALEVGLDLAIQLEALASRTALEGILDDIAPKLRTSQVSATLVA